MDNKVAVLNAKMSIDELIRENPSVYFHDVDNVLSNHKGSWAFVWENDLGRICLTAERHVPEDMLIELLEKYGGELYKCERDKMPTKVFTGNHSYKNVDELVACATQLSSQQGQAVKCNDGRDYYG